MKSIYLIKESLSKESLASLIEQSKKLGVVLEENKFIAVLNKNSNQ